MGDRTSPDIDVGVKCHVQKAAKRFGAKSAEDINEWVWANPASVFPDEDEFDDDDDDDEAASDGQSDNDEAASDFAAAASFFSNIAPDQEDDGQDFVELSTGHHKIPRGARARSNLTALSQRYNVSR